MGNSRVSVVPLKGQSYALGKQKLTLWIDKLIINYIKLCKSDIKLQPKVTGYIFPLWKANASKRVKDEYLVSFIDTQGWAVF